MKEFSAFTLSIFVFHLYSFSSSQKNLMTTDLIKHSKLVKVSIIKLINYEYIKSALRAFKYYIYFDLLHTIYYTIGRKLKFLLFLRNTNVRSPIFLLMKDFLLSLYQSIIIYLHYSFISSPKTLMTTDLIKHSKLGSMPIISS